VSESLLPLARVVLNEQPYISESHVVNCLALLYARGEYRVVAELCDVLLDPTGRLLGLVRKAATGV